MGDFSPSTGNLLLSSGRTLPALKTIGLVSHDSGGHYTHTGPLLSLAPNLQTLHAIDARHTDVRVQPLPNRLSDVAPLRGSSGPSLFPALQKAVLHDLGREALFAIVQGAPALRELRYTEIGSETREDDYFWDLAKGLEPARDTLRRLVLQVPAAPRPQSSGAAVGSLAGFPKLEVLSISQDAVYGYGLREDSVSPLAGGLVGFLPPSLAVLCISQVCQEFGGELRGLARDAPRCLPRLRSVTVGCGVSEVVIPYSIEREALGFFGEKVRAELRDVFAEAGIVLRWGPVIEGEDEVVPGLPVREAHPEDDPGWSWDLATLLVQLGSTE
jgi:hypothetical protein